MSTFYVTTPIYYVNDRPHIGHCYTTCVADVLARYRRLMGDDVLFLTGTDEHADKVIAKAVEHKVTEQEWVDRCAAEFVRAFEMMGFSNDLFYRTSDEHHKRLARQYISELVAKGDVYLGDYVGWYDESQDEYMTETVAKESNYVSPVTGKPLQKRTEKNYFFRLSKYEGALLKLLEERPDFVRPAERRNEVLGRLKGGLQDVPVSRAIKPGESTWGVLMPGDEGHRVYVWIEALCNYLTAVDTPERKNYWPPRAHLMAKDILWFHAVVWPAMLLALGRPLPATVYAHAYWVREGRKMSKSLGNFVDLDVLKAYCDRYSRDALRHYLITQGPQGSSDADFAHGKFVETFNAELANGIGNATSRVGNMIEKYFGGNVPDPNAGAPAYAVDSLRLERASADAVRACEGAVERIDLAAAVGAGVRLGRQVDEYISAWAPFKLAKDPANLPVVGHILYQCAEALRIATVLLSPSMPDKMRAAQEAWGCVPKADVPLKELCAFGGPHGLKPGQQVRKGDVLFMRADPAEPAPGGSA